MKRIIYYSVARPGITYTEINDILNVSTQANRQYAITGMLIFNGTYFMQCIEGPDEAINRLMTNLYNDPRHTDVTVIGEETADERFFPQWSMGYLNREKQIREVLFSHTANESFEPSALTMRQATSILVDLSFII